jgi:fumarate reductase subunit D
MAGPASTGLPVGLHVHPVPAKPVYWVLAGMASLMAALVAAPVPLLLTVIVYALTLPTDKTGTGDDLTTDNTGVVTVRHF